MGEFSTASTSCGCTSRSGSGGWLLSSSRARWKISGWGLPRRTSSAETMAVYMTLREEHDPKAEALIQEARQAFRNGDREGGKAKYQEVLDTWFAAGKYPIVKRWVEGMD